MLQHLPVSQLDFDLWLNKVKFTKIQWLSSLIAVHENSRRQTYKMP